MFQIVSDERADFLLPRGNRFSTHVDNCGTANLAGFNSARELEGREHQNFLSSDAAIAPASRRTREIAMKAVIAATGQPIIKAESQRFTKSGWRPIFAQVTTALTINTMTAV